MPGFDPAFYLRQNPDVATAGLDPLKHFLAHGWLENRDPSPGFSVSAYLSANPDVAAAEVNPLVHYNENGLSEGRPLGIGTDRAEPLPQSSIALPDKRSRTVVSLPPSQDARSRVAMFHRAGPGVAARVL